MLPHYNLRVATTPRTKADDARLKKALEHADIGKFQQVLQKSFEKVLIPTKKKAKKNPS